MKPDYHQPTHSLQQGEVHTWWFNLEGMQQPFPGWEGLLSREEKGRADRFKFEGDRLRFIARRGILRQLLGGYTGMDPRRIRYQVNPHGKPSLGEPALHFNLSGSADRVAIAIALDMEIGVDIEKIRPLPDLSRLIKRWFSAREQAELRVLSAERLEQAFFHTWTMKEAFLKAKGMGLAFPLQDFSVSVDPEQPARLVEIQGDQAEPSRWKMAAFAPEAGWRLAICAAGEVEPEVCMVMPSLAEFLAEHSTG